MVYAILIAVFVIILPFSIKSRTAFLQRRVAHKAKLHGVEVKFD